MTIPFAIAAQAQQLTTSLISGTSMAQSIQEHFALKNRELPPIPTTYIQNDGAKPTVAKSRIKSYSSYRFNGTAYEGRNDSLSFHWSGTRGGDFDYAHFVTFARVAALEQVLPYGELEYLLDMYKLISFDSMLTFRWKNADNAFTELKEKETVKLGIDGMAEMHSSYDYIGGQWENSSRSNLSWDAGELTLFHSQDWDGATWENSNRTTLSYNSSKDLTGYNSYDWNSTNLAWVNSSRAVYNYAGAVLENHITQSWHDLDNKWINSARSIYGYDGGNVSTITEQRWDDVTESWDSRSRAAYTWTQGKVTERIMQKWTSGAWENDAKFLYSFDAAGNITSLRTQRWDGGVWEDVSRYTYEYATTGSGISITVAFEEWDVVNSEWKKMARMILQRNEHNRITELALQSWDPGGFWDVKNGDEKQVFTYEIFDDGTIAGVTQLNKPSGISCYPNPASAQFTVSAVEGRLQQIRMMDVSGRTLQQLTFGQGLQHAVVPTADLAPGTYFLQVLHDGQMETVPVQVIR